MEHKRLLLLEHNGEDLTEPSRRLCEYMVRSAGQSNGEMAAVVFGACREEALRSLGICGLQKIYQILGPAEDFYSPEHRVCSLRQLTARARPNLIILPSTLWGREMAPLLAFQLEAGFVSDCVRLHLRVETTEVVLNIYNGQYQRICELSGPVNVILMADIEGGVFDSLEQDEAEVIIASAAEKRTEPALRVLEAFTLPATDLDIGEADVVVGIGRGVETPADWELMKELAHTMQAPIGGTRPAVDAGWLPFAKQIGQTGRIIAPELYLAAGISGAQQHISGVEKAKIIAINTDHTAPILRLADLGVVGDFREIVPILAQKLQANRKERKQ